MTLKAGSDQRWVCAACGKFTELGASRFALRDSSCVTWATLCKADQDAEGRWVAEPEQPGDCVAGTAPLDVVMEP